MTAYKVTYDLNQDHEGNPKHKHPESQYLMEDELDDVLHWLRSRGKEFIIRTIPFSEIESKRDLFKIQLQGSKERLIKNEAGFKVWDRLYRKSKEANNE